QSPLQQSLSHTPIQSQIPVESTPDDPLTKDLLHRYSRYLKRVKKYAEAIEEDEYEESDAVGQIKLLRQIEKEVIKFLKVNSPIDSPPETRSKKRKLSTPPPIPTPTRVAHDLWKKRQLQESQYIQYFDQQT